MLGDQLPEPIFGHAPRLGNARHLKKRRLGRDMRVKTAARRCDQVLGNGRGRILGLQFVYVTLDALDERLVSRTKFEPPEFAAL